MNLLYQRLKRTPLEIPARRVYRWARSTAARLRRALPGACSISDKGAQNVVLKCDSCVLRKVVVTIRGDGNVVTFGEGLGLVRARISIEGSGNRLTLGCDGTMSDLVVSIQGDCNTVSVSDRCVLRNTSFVCEDSANSISLGASTTLAGSTELAAIEGTRITIGGECLFSGGIHFRTGDSHSLTDLNGRRINPSADITIGDHVWVARNVTALKGSAVADSSVVGACAVLTKKFDRPHCAIAGNPAKVIGEGIDWKAERLPCS